jgi:hypothetical protein
MLPNLPLSAEKPLSQMFIWKYSDGKSTGEAIIIVSARAEARISLMQEQGNSLKLEYMLKDEVRAKKNLPPLPLGEGQTLKQSQTPSSFGVSTSPQGQNLADAKVSNAHPEFVASMQKLIDAAKIGALTRAGAIHEAEHLIGNYSRTREQDALNWLQKRTNQPPLLVLPPEMQLQLETQRKLYLEQFVKIVDDTRK